MAEPIYRYFSVMESDIPHVLQACTESLGEYERRSKELREKHGIHKFMIYRNAARSEKARRRGADDPAEHMDVLVLFKKTDHEKQIEAMLKSADDSERKNIKQIQKNFHPGFTSVNGSAGKTDPDYILYKVDLRKREGKEVFAEFMELHVLNPDDRKPYQYIADCFGLQHTLVPNRSGRSRSKYAYYDTYGERVGEGTEACWIFAVPVYSPEFASLSGHGSDSLRGLREDFIPSDPVRELTEEEFRSLRGNK